MNKKKSKFSPVGKKERINVLDALRGFAIFGIFMINVRVFSGYAYMVDEQKNELMLANWNSAFDIFHSLFFGGKFYTLFSLLFGIGFAIQFIRASSTDRSFNRHFSRRLFILLIIGIVHLWGIWFSDILVLYALCGYVLILFKGFSDRGLLWAAFITLCIPGFYLWHVHSVDGGYINNIYDYFNEKWAEAGLPYASENSFFQMRDVVEVIQSTSWSTILSFNYLGPLLRGYIYTLDARFFNVMGVFIVGLWVGRKLMFNKIHKNRSFLIRTAAVGLIIGLPLNVFFIMDNSTGLNESTIRLLKDTLQPFGYLSLTAGYSAIFMLLFHSKISSHLDTLFNSVGKTALTNYIGQSFIGIFLFYGVGLGIGQYLGSAFLTLIVFIVFAFQVIISNLWLKRYRYGPLEWLWRSLTYGRFMNNRKEKKGTKG